jgi:hypothetical protein
VLLSVPAVTEFPLDPASWIHWRTDLNEADPAGRLREASRSAG